MLFRPFPRAFRAILLRLDPLFYALWAAACTIASARVFYGYMMKQTGGEWSAPLDDVFIHFDYARSTALGHPFEWVAGNGYSSGNTSLTYPFILAFGWLVGFRDVRLMIWAAVVAQVCVFGLLLAARPLFLTRSFTDLFAAGGGAPKAATRGHDGFGRAGSYLFPPLFLGVGALDWSLWSGMEVAVFLGAWAIALRVWMALLAEPIGSRSRARLGWMLGAAGALLVVTRPEAATTIAAFGITSLPSLAGSRWRRARDLTTHLLRVGSPAALFLAAQSIANRAFTGEWTANGAIVKLAVYNPFFTAQEKLDDYIFNLRYAVLRNVEYHFTDRPDLGVLVPALALAALALPSTRRAAALLWLQLASWLLLVAMNGQVRWQNERYTMPAVAWLLVAAALGAVGLVRARGGKPRILAGALAGAAALQLYAVTLRPLGAEPTLRLSWAVAIAGGLLGSLVLRAHAIRIAVVGAALFFAHEHQISKMRDQKWFFGRASRNIRDQHVVAGRWLAHVKPRRVLVGDAGALIYASDRPGLDVIGLGGLGKFPFARAGLHGLAATLELMEYVPSSERPDVLAIYPSWWGVLPTWFASRELARFPAEGNVICGGYEDVIYKADWHLLGTGNDPRAIPPGESVRDDIDVADLISEKAHAYVFPHPAGGYTEMKILADPADHDADVFDGGRRIGPGREERFDVRRAIPNRPAHLLVRTAPEQRSHVRVRANGREIAAIELDPAEAWVERSIAIPADLVTAETSIAITNDGPEDFIDYHVWVTQ